MARYQQMLNLKGPHMDVHYYQFSVCLKLFHNKKGGGEPSDLQFSQGKNTT